MKEASPEELLYVRSLAGSNAAVVPLWFPIFGIFHLLRNINGHSYIGLNQHYML